MSVDYKDFFTAAEAALSAEHATEIDCRNAASRAYYGAYHAALGYADGVRLPPVSALAGSTHEKLRTFYQMDAFPDPDIQKQHRKIGYMLKQIHDLRVVADYKLDQTVTPTTAKSQLLTCEKVESMVFALIRASAVNQAKVL